jgi:hypothetical protein
MVAARKLRQPDVIDYPPLTPAQKLDAAINQRFDALMAKLTDEPLTDAEWRDVFLLWDIRKLFDYGLLSEAAYVLTKVGANTIPVRP